MPEALEAGGIRIANVKLATAEFDYYGRMWWKGDGRDRIYDYGGGRR
jgi:hypothetical protein